METIDKKDDLQYRAGAIVLDHSLNYCLMVYQRNSELWGIPKGRREIHSGEDYRTCMFREVLEETGLDLNIQEFEYLDKLQIHTQCRIYVVRLLCSELPTCHPPCEDGRENSEISRVEWTPLHEAFQRKVNSITRRSLQTLRGRLDTLKYAKGLIVEDLACVLPPDIEELLLKK
jgi:8-oxo-dGTP pyrophosphatase MutT (NUDIX family)